MNEDDALEGGCSGSGKDLGGGGQQGSVDPVDGVATLGEAEGAGAIN